MAERLCVFCEKEPIAPRRSKYCSEACANDASRVAAGRKPVKNRRQRCQLKGCRNLLDPGQRAWCSPEHELEAGRRIMEQKREVQTRTGRGYDAFVRDGFAKMIADHLMTIEEVAEVRDVHPVQVERWMAEYHAQELTAEMGGAWEMTDEAKAGLEDFAKFRELVFLTENGEQFVTKPFHLKWIRAIEKTIEHGARLQILSPPRHGKTKLLIHFCIWMMIRNPNIRILWVSASLALSQRWNNAIRDELTNNHTLRELYLPPGQGFRPRGQVWSADEFVIGTRTVAGISAPTFTSKGSKGKILSLDADLIICDDLEDDSTTAIPSTREKVRHWWNVTVLSRKEDHTALIMIGSRQHVDDLYSKNLNSPIWEVITEHAHDPVCPIPEDEEDRHIDCMLWPERHPFSWLMEQRTEAASTVGVEVFEMVYLNAPTATGLATFRAADIDQCKDPSSVLKVPPPEHVLIAGLDPALTGYQAGFLWAYNPHTDTEQMVDLENRKGGGPRAAYDLIRSWFELYQVHYFVVEDQNFQALYIDDDSEIRKFCNANAIMLEGHNTGTLKHDRAFGVAASASRFEQGKITLPYGDAYSQQKVDLFRGQLIGWSADMVARTGTARGYRADVVMASWFPRKVMRRLRAQASIEVTDTSPRSFAGYDLDTYGSQIPWGPSA